VNMAVLIAEDSNAKNHFKSELNDALAFVEEQMPWGQDIVTIQDYEARAVSPDWVYALNGYRTWSSATDIGCETDQYFMKWTIHLRDVYDWKLNSTKGAVPLPSGEHLLYDSDMEAGSGSGV